MDNSPFVDLQWCNFNWWFAYPVKFILPVVNTDNGLGCEFKTGDEEPDEVYMRLQKAVKDGLAFLGWFGPSFTNVYES